MQEKNQQNPATGIQGPDTKQRDKKTSIFK
jgi:hypothetical protein